MRKICILLALLCLLVISPVSVQSAGEVPGLSNVVIVGNTSLPADLTELDAVCATAKKGQRFLAESLPFTVDGKKWLRLVSTVDSRGQPGSLPAACRDAFVRIEAVSDSPDVPTSLVSATHYVQGYSAVDSSMATQRRMAEQAAVRWVGLKGEPATVPMRLTPAVNATLLKPAVTIDAFYTRHEFVAVERREGLLRIVDLSNRCPSAWIEAKAVVMPDSGDGRGYGQQVVLNLGANILEMQRRWGKAEIVRADSEDNLLPGETLLRFDGLEVRYRNSRNVSLSLTRNGAGLGGIFIGQEWCDKDWIARTFASLGIQKHRAQDGVERWELTGGPDGWNYSMTLTFGSNGLVRQMDFDCADVNLLN